MKLKITRTTVVIALIFLGIATVFLNFWLFDETKIFNDVTEKDYGWIHMAVNALVIIFDITYIIYAIWEFSNDSPPFKKMRHFYLLLLLEKTQKEIQKNIRHIKVESLMQNLLIYLYRKEIQKI